MSLQNILVPNNYDLYARTFTTEEFSSDTITTNNINSLNDPNDNITVTGNLVVVADDAFDLGASGKGFNNLYCRNLNGLNGPVNVTTGVRGNNGTNPVIIYQYGLQFLPDPNDANPSQSVLNNYFNSQGTIEILGCFTLNPLTANYSITVVGNIVTFCLGYFTGNPSSNGPITISFASIPEILPVSTQAFTIPMRFGGTRSVVGGIVTSTGIIIYSDLNSGSFTTAMTPTEPSIPNGSFYVITYQLN